MIATAPECGECEDFYPDEFLDLFAINNNSVISSGMLRPRPSIFSFFDFHPKAHAFQCPLENSSPKPLASERVLSVSLRC